MLGFYDYTVVLTYLSLISAGLGIIVSLSGSGHPFIGVFCLMFSGLFDAFDGKVARMKKNRSEMATKYGIQIDSLADVVAFGILPGCIGAAMIKSSSFLNGAISSTWYGMALRYGGYAILLLYMLAALIRLGYFNVTEEERQKKEKGVRASYTGLPVTSASLIFPTVLLLQFVIPKDITLVYLIVALITGFLFLSKLNIKKPGLRGILIMVAVGLVECGLLIFGLLTR